ncbi:MAG: restriction endonuclease subunit S [Solobacterium sp.]|nr:restriction endonuclease subunit S [Solobacterium sp.]
MNACLSTSIDIISLVNNYSFYPSCANKDFKIKIDKEYFCYAIRNSLSAMSQQTHGATMKHITKKDFDNILIPYPDLNVQRQIANNLETVNELIESYEKELILLEQLVKARFVEMFGDINNNIYDYDIRCLNDVCEFIKDGTHQTPIYTQDKENGYKFMSSKDVVLGSIDWNHLKYIPEDLHKELYKHISPRRGDILLAKNGTTGIAAMVDRDEVFDIYVSLAILRPLNINSTYLLFAINSNTTKRQFDACLKGIGVPNLHLGEIKKAKIIVPPLDKQIDFEKYAKQVDKSKFIQMNSTI